MIFALSDRWLIPKSSFKTDDLIYIRWKPLFAKSTTLAGMNMFWHTQREPFFTSGSGGKLFRPASAMSHYISVRQIKAKFREFFHYSSCGALSSAEVLWPFR